MHALCLPLLERHIAVVEVTEHGTMIQKQGSTGCMRFAATIGRIPR